MSRPKRDEARLPSDSEIEAVLRVERALEYLEDAQAKLEIAAQQLSGCTGVLRQWKTAGRLRERVRSLWYAVNERRSQVDLDSLGKKRLAEEQGGGANG